MRYPLGMKIRIEKRLMGPSDIDRLMAFLRARDFVAIYDHDGTPGTIERLETTRAFAAKRPLLVTIDLEFASEETAMECVLKFA